VAWDADAGVYWLTSGSTVFRVGISDDDVQGSYTLSTGSGPTSLGVTLVDSERVAVIDRQTTFVYVLSTASDGKIQLDQTLLVSFVPHSITYDGAYEVYFATSVDDKTSVVELDGRGRERVIFTMNDEALAGVEISNMHYASNTGTLFFLCTPCMMLYEVTLTGRLRSPASMAAVDSSLGVVTGISIDRTGSPLVLLSQSLTLTEKCQNILPPSPVLPPEKAYTPQPQTWFRLKTYSMCGARRLEGVTGPRLSALAVNPSTRTLWAAADGRISEFDLSGKLLRTLKAEDVSAAGLDDATCISWMKGQTLMFGMRTGNRIAVIDMKPDPPEDYYGDDDYREPPGQDYEDEVARRINAFEVLSTLDIPTDLLEPNSLGSCFFENDKEMVVFASSGGSAKGVLQVSLDGEGGEQMLAGDSLGDVTSIDSVLYSPGQDSFLLWCALCSTLYEVPSKFATPSNERLFTDYLAGSGESLASALTLTPEGALMLIAGPAGDVTFYCSTGQESDGGLLAVVRSGFQPDVNLEYFWRTVEIQQDLQPPSPDGSDTRFLDGDLYTQLFGVACLDPVLLLLPAERQVTCEDLCSSSPQCRAYTYKLDASECMLHTTCDSQAIVLTSSSAVRNSLS